VNGWRLIVWATYNDREGVPAELLDSPERVKVEAAGIAPA